MNVKLQSLKLRNFKGAKNLEVNFSGITNIYGDNATFKTTIFDAFTWLLFGKNSQDKKDFGIKTLDSNNVEISDIEHEVEGVLLVDGETMVLTRTLKEKWVKKRGEEGAVFTGNTTDYTVDGVPKPDKEYSKIIGEIINETTFKLITSPLYFNDVLKWNERRDSLIKMAGSISYADVAATDNRFAELVEIIEKKSIKGYKDQLNAQKRKVKEQLATIQPRIDENNNNITEGIDETLLKGELVKLEVKLKAADNDIFQVAEQFKTLNKGYTDKLDVISGLKRDLHRVKNQVEFDENEKVDKVKRERASADQTVKSNQQTIDLLGKENVQYLVQVDSLNTDLDKKRKEYDTETDKVLTIDESKFVCPTCNRELEPGDIEEERAEMQKNFNANQVRKINNIKAEGIRMAERQKNILGKIEENKKEIERLFPSVAVEPVEKEVIPEINIDLLLESNTEYQSLKKEIQAKEEALKVPEQADNSALNDVRKHIQLEIDDVNSNLQIAKINKDAAARIQELMEQRKTLSQELANSEKDEFLIEQFNKAYMELVESKIASMFTTVKFRMFKKLVNGGEEEDCTLLYNGVPWSDLNHARTIQAGIDCINAISKHFNTEAPIWIDNAEAVTSIPKTKSQVINLYVSAKDKTLRIE